MDEELCPRKKFKLNNEKNRPCSKLEALVQIAEFMYQYEVRPPPSSTKSNPSTLLSLLNPVNTITESLFSKEISIKEKYHGEVKEFSPLPVSQSIHIQGLVQDINNLMDFKPTFKTNNSKTFNSSFDRFGFGNTMSNNFGLSHKQNHYQIL